MEGTLAFPTLDQCDSGCDCMGARTAEESRRSWKVEDASAEPPLFVVYLYHPSFLLADQAYPWTPDDKAREPVL